MTLRERYELNQSVGIKTELKDFLKVIADSLLDALYIPNYQGVANKLDHNRLKHFEIDKTEPVNWGASLSSSVEINGDEITILIEEASPDSCPTLCAYIESHIREYGWEVTVKTEW